MTDNDQLHKPQKCFRSISNERRTADHLAVRRGLNVVHMRDLMKTASQNFQGHATVVAPSVHLLSQREAKRYSEANQETRMQKAAQLVDGLLDLDAEPQSRHTRTHRRKKHARRHQKDSDSNPTTNTAVLDKSYYLAEINPNQGPRHLKADVKRDHGRDEEDGYASDDSPSDAACAHGDYSYIYDLYLQEI